VGNAPLPRRRNLQVTDGTERDRISSFCEWYTTKYWYRNAMHCFGVSIRRSTIRRLSRSKKVRPEESDLTSPGGTLSLSICLHIHAASMEEIRFWFGTELESRIVPRNIQSSLERHPPTTDRCATTAAIVVTVVQRLTRSSGWDQTNRCLT
jgi:hypothetical protein